MLNVVILLTMLMAFFAVVGYYIFGYEEETGDKENWGTLSTAMLTLFTFVTVSYGLSYFLNITVVYSSRINSILQVVYVTVNKQVAMCACVLCNCDNYST